MYTTQSGVCKHITARDFRIIDCSVVSKEAHAVTSNTRAALMLTTQSLVATQKCCSDFATLRLDTWETSVPHASRNRYLFFPTIVSLHKNMTIDVKLKQKYTSSQVVSLSPNDVIFFSFSFSSSSKFSIFLYICCCFFFWAVIFLVNSFKYCTQP